MAYNNTQLRRINSGLCFECESPALEGSKRCESHAEAQRRRNSTANPKAYQRFKNSNLCARCGRRPPREGSVTCTSCREDGKLFKPSPEAKQRRAETHRIWVANHPGYMTEANHRSRLKNKENVKKQKLNNARKHRDRVNQANRRAYRRAMADPMKKARIFACAHRRRAHKMSAAGTHTAEQWLARVSYFGWLCKWCHRELTIKTLTKDHVIALSRGGSDWPSNLVPACGPCNSGKHTKRHYAPPC